MLRSSSALFTILKGYISGSCKTEDDIDNQAVKLKGLTDTFFKLGGIYGKIAQMLSYDETRTDVYDECECVFQSQTTNAFNELMRSDFGAHFANVDMDIYRAGSIGQVHRAILKDGNAKVVIKMRYVGISEAMASDLYILNKFGSLVFSFANFECSAEKVESLVKQELNYELEVYNIERLGEIWAGDVEICIPRVYSSLCRPNLIVMEDADAETLRTFITNASREECIRIGMSIVRFMFHTLYGHGLLYTDIHMGNLFVRPDGQLVVIDFGSIDVIDADVLDTMKSVHRALLVNDREGFYRAVEKVGIKQPDISLESKTYMYDYFAFQYEPWTLPYFEFTDEWMTRSMKKNPTLMKEWRLPASLVFWNKITFGMYHVLHRLKLKGALSDIALASL